MKNFIPLTVLFIGCFFVILGVYSLNYPITHHGYIRVLEQNIANCVTWSCFKQSSFDHNLRGYLFIKFILLKTFSPKNFLTLEWLSSSLLGAFFISTLFYSYKRILKKTSLSLGVTLLVLLCSPVILKQLFYGEDNIAYYGFITLFFFYSLKEVKKVYLEGILAGLFLGLAVLAHVSPLVFYFYLLAAPCLFYIKKEEGQKAAISTFVGLITYSLGFFLLNLDYALHRPIFSLFHQSPISVYAKKAIGFEKSGSVLEGDGFFELLSRGMELSHWHFQIEYPEWYLLLIPSILFIVFLIFNYKVDKLNPIMDLKAFFLIGLSLCIPVFYEPQFAERWDFFIILFPMILILKFKDQKSFKFLGLALFLILFEITNSFAAYFSRSPYRLEQERFVNEFNILLPKLSDKEVLVFPLEMIAIDPHIIANLKGREAQVYFFDRDSKSFYQTYYSLIAKGKYTMSDLWKFSHFDAWGGIFERPKSISAEKIDKPCELLENDKAYINDSLLSLMNKECGK